MFPLLPLLCAFYFLIVGFFVIKNNAKDPLARIFFAVCLSTFCWHYPFSFAYNSLNQEFAYLLFKIGWCSILFLPTTIYHFFVILSGKKQENKFVYYSYIYSAILLVVHILTNLVISTTYSMDWGFYPRSGVLEALHISQTFVVVSRGLYLALLSLKELDYKKRSQVKYCIAGFLIYLFAATDYLVTYGVVTLPPPPGFIFVTISLTIISYSIVRHSLLDIGVLFSAALSKVIIYLLFLLLFIIGHAFFVGSYLPDNLRNFGIAILLVVFSCETYSFLLGKIRGISDMVFTQTRKKERAINGIISSLENLYLSLDVALKLQEYFAEEFQIKINSFYSLKSTSKENGNLYEELLLKNNLQKTLLIPQGLYNKILNKESYLLKSEFKKLIPHIKGEHCLVPFIFAKKILGFCVVSVDKNLESWHYDLFNSLTREIGMILDRIRIYQDLLAKQEEYIKEEARSKIYKTLAGSIAHEVRNPLNAINIVNNQINDALRNLDNEIMDIVTQSVPSGKGDKNKK